MKLAMMTQTPPTSEARAGERTVKYVALQVDKKASLKTDWNIIGNRSIISLRDMSFHVAFSSLSRACGMKIRTLVLSDR